MFFANELIFEWLQKVLLQVVPDRELLHTVVEHDVEGVLVVEKADILVLRNETNGFVLHIILPPPVEIDEHDSCVQVLVGAFKRKSVQVTDVVAAHVRCCHGCDSVERHVP